MNAFYGFFLLIFCIGQCHSHGPLSLFDGVNATEGEFPYMVSIRLGTIGEHDCGGSIIGPTWILTAAHCMRLEAVRFGTIKLNNYRTDPEYTVKIKNYYPHPDFEMIRVNRSWGYPINDIALYEVEEPIPYGPNVQPIKLAAKNQSIPYNKMGIFTGWGFTTNTGDCPDNLQKINITLYEPDYCIHNSMDLYQNDGTDICAGSDKKGRGVCYKDSGGPFVVDGIQYGVLSWMTIPCGSHVVGFSNIAHFRDWIFSISGI
ncbi:chymotrypsin-2-like [Anthonomus grandis grandis]|uniref:chymotrypsin-2-like n=1 Tax=Anthonomus grandis grandis TaxID=2921223 RepID=UPI0021660220|nr:chymotrypsin-2-like [Anthonomus grandis grandis]